MAGSGSEGNRHRAGLNGEMGACGMHLSKAMQAGMAK